MDIPPIVEVLSQYWCNVPIENITDPKKIEGIGTGFSLHMNLKDLRSFADRESPYGADKLRPVGPPRKYQIFKIPNSDDCPQSARAGFLASEKEILRRIKDSKDGIMLYTYPAWRSDMRPIDVKSIEAIKGFQIAYLRLGAFLGL